MALKTHFLNDKKLPIVFTNTNNKLDIVDWAKSHKEELRTLLSEYGAILFRGFPIHGVEDFERFAEACTSADWVEYLEATSPRDHVKSNTATSTKYDKNRTIFFHNEKSYSSVWPKYLIFYCDVPPNIGGETPLSNCRLVYRDIPDDVRQKFEAKKLMYVRRFSNNMGIPWKKAFNVETREELESYCGRNFIENLSWNDDGTPVLEYCRDTSIVHPDTGLTTARFLMCILLNPISKTFSFQTSARMVCLTIPITAMVRKLRRMLLQRYAVYTRNIRVLFRGNLATFFLSTICSFLMVVDHFNQTAIYLLR